MSGEEIAKAFKGEDVSGAMVLGEWYQEFDSAGTMVAGIDAVNVDFSVNDSTLTLIDKQSGAPLNNGIPLGIKGMETDAQFMNALKVTGGANPPKVTIKTTTKQGQDEATIHADSYVNLALSVAGDTSTKTEFAKSIDELGTLSSISNFELGIDKLTLY